MNWLALILLVPLILVPVVLLCGFAGCAEIAGIRDSDPVPSLPPPPAAPTGLKATAVSHNEIDLEWDDVSGGAATFTVLRESSSNSFAPVADGVPPTPGSAKVTHHDTQNLTPETTFWYRVRAKVGTDKSSLSNFASARTFPAPVPPPPVWRTAYPVSPQPLNQNGGNFTNATVVQRINSALLSPAAAGGTRVRIVVQSSDTASLDLLKTTISQAAPSGNVFDSAPSPAPFSKVLYNGGNDSITLPKASQATSDAVDFSFDPTKDLIIAFKIGTNGAGRRRQGVVGAQFFSQNNVDEAEVRDRTPPYATQTDVVYFIEKIEVT